MAQPKKNPSRRRADPALDSDRHAQIIAAARRTFIEKGNSVSMASVREIARTAGMSDGLIYHYFESKEDLFYEAIVSPLHEALQGSLRVIGDRASGPSAEERLQSEREFLRSLIESWAEVLPLLGIVLFGGSERSKTFYRASFAPSVREIERAFESERVSDVEVGYSSATLARTVVGAVLVFALEARLSGRELDLDATVDELARLLTVASQPFFAAPRDARGAKADRPGRGKQS